MAGDWIKMRVWLAKDPRVIKMADYLAEQRPFMDWLTDPVRQSCKESAYEHVTRNVTVALCVTGLLVTWGTAREQGDRIGDDLVLNHCDKYTLDSITDIECFGEAMEHVGWIECSSDSSITFPKFFKDNESPDEKHKRQNAERQAKHREKIANESNAESNVTRNVTVTTEKRREEKRRDIKNQEENPTASPSLDLPSVIFKHGKSLLGDKAGSIIGAARKRVGDEKVGEVIASMSIQKPPISDPIPYFIAATTPKKRGFVC